MPLSHSMREGGTSARPLRARGLYLVTPDIADTGALLARVQSVLPYATWLQYRNKTAGAALRREQVLALLPACRARGVALLVNDDWRLAAQCRADGVHLGEEDGALSDARDALGTGAIIGASCYDSLALARDAVATGADYVAFGAFFPSQTKATTRRAGLQLLRESSGLGVPRVAIGGITADNGPALVAAGADLLAIVGAVFHAPDPAAAARACLRAFSAASPRADD